MFTDLRTDIILGSLEPGERFCPMRCRHCVHSRQERRRHGDEKCAAPPVLCKADPEDWMAVENCCPFKRADVS